MRLIYFSNYVWMITFWLGILRIQTNCTSVGRKRINMECEPYTYLSSFLLRYIVIQLSVSGSHCEENRECIGSGQFRVNCMQHVCLTFQWIPIRYLSKRKSISFQNVSFNGSQISQFSFVVTLLCLSKRS